MAKFKVGDVVKPLPSEGGHLHPYLAAGKNYTIEGYTSKCGVNVSGEFRNGGNGLDWDEDWFELVETSSSVESIRKSILDIRSKREPLQKKVLQLEEQEKELVAQLKGKGFALID